MWELIADLFVDALWWPWLLKWVFPIGLVITGGVMTYLAQPYGVWILVLGAAWLVASIFYHRSEKLY